MILNRTVTKKADGAQLVKESSLIASCEGVTSFSSSVALREPLVMFLFIVLPFPGGHALFSGFLHIEEIPTYLLNDKKNCLIFLRKYFYTPIFTLIQLNITFLSFSTFFTCICWCPSL